MIKMINWTKLTFLNRSATVKVEFICTANSSQLTKRNQILICNVFV